MTTKTKVRNLLRIPPRHRVNDTDFLVDAFWYRSPDVTHWFLTHFHSDHYGGLDADFDNGWIYCTPTTSRLVISNLKVLPEIIKIIDFNKPTVVAGVQVTALDANHCPGSAMLLFQHKSGLSILHSGDFRYHPRMQSYVIQDVDYLYLDTTYCNPKYKLPTQDKAIESVVNIVKQNFKEKVLFLVGAYKIGKERIILELFKELKCKVYISAQRFNDLKCCDIPEFDQIFTRNESESRIHVVPMMHLSFKQLPKLEAKLGTSYDRIVAFKPTGWSLSTKKDVTVKSIGKIHLASIAYSEHSSYNELREFVRFARPKKIIPTVNSNSKSQTEKLLVNFSDIIDSSKDKSKIPFYFPRKEPPVDRKRKLEIEPIIVNKENPLMKPKTIQGIWKRFFTGQTEIFDLDSVDVDEQNRILDEIQSNALKQ